MLVRISHRIVHEFAVPARGVTQILRLTPRNHEGQRIAYWRIDADLDCALRAAEDAFGNITHACTAAGPMSRFTINVDGEIETFETAGVASGATERFPPELFLRPTDLTRADDAMREFSMAIMARADTRLARMHELMDALHERLKPLDAGAYAGDPAASAFAAGAGFAHDFAHVLVACARLMDAPARFVSGYILPDEDAVGQELGHAWAEVYIENLGWVGFDALTGESPRERHVSLARGLDHLGAAPFRGARSGGDGETIVETFRVARVAARPRY